MNYEKQERKKIIKEIIQRSKLEDEIRGRDSAEKKFKEWKKNQNQFGSGKKLQEYKKNQNQFRSRKKLQKYKEENE